MQKILSKKFQLPKKLMDDLYEASGGADKYKGFIIAISDENGETKVCTHSESPIIHDGLVRGLERYISSEEIDLD